MRYLCLLPLILISLPAAAQSTRTAEYYSNARQRQEVVAADTARGGLMSKVLGDLGSYNYIIARRVLTGEVEIHRDWDDVMVIQEGSGIMMHGGRATGGRDTGPGEYRGGEIVGGTAQQFAAGDMLVIPAGVPHQFRLLPGQAVTYAVVKAQPRAPAGR